MSRQQRCQSCHGETESDDENMHSEQVYALPEEWRILNSELASRLNPSESEIESGQVRRIVTSSPKSLAIFELPTEESRFSWEEFGLQFANGIVSGAAGFVVGEMLKMLRPAPTLKLHKDALLAIKEILMEVIDNAFLRHYQGEVTGIRQQLLSYDDTNDVARLDSALDRGFDLVPRIHGLGRKGLGAFMMAANLHLAAVRAKTELDGSYRATFNRLRVEYKGQGLQLANSARARLERRVGECECTYVPPDPDPDPVHDPDSDSIIERGGDYTTCNFDYDWGAGNRYFGRNDYRDCTGARETYYRSGTIDAIQRKINPIVLICNKW